MAKFETIISGDFYSLLHEITECACESISATLEDSSDFVTGDCRCSVRVFERYSWTGSNRVSLNLTLFQKGNGPVHVSAITSGGSQAMLFKINTIGEEAFLDKIREYFDRIQYK